MNKKKKTVCLVDDSIDILPMELQPLIRRKKENVHIFFSVIDG